MSNRLRNIAKRLGVAPVNPTACDDHPETGVTHRAELPTPAGATLQHRGEVQELTGAHRRTWVKLVGRVDHAGNAVAVPKRVREVVAVTAAGERVVFDPAVWRLFVTQHRAGGGYR